MIRIIEGLTLLAERAISLVEKYKFIALGCNHLRCARGGCFGLECHRPEFENKGCNIQNFRHRSACAMFFLAELYLALGYVVNVNDSRRAPDWKTKAKTTITCTWPALKPQTLARGIRIPGLQAFTFEVCVLVPALAARQTMASRCFMQKSAISWTSLVPEAAAC